MKKIYTIFFSILLTSSLFAQAPQKMSYQAVIRDNLDHLVTSHAVGIQITILQGSPTGTVVYTETQTPSTNANGLISIEIGGGAGFSSIDWANGTFFLKTETDPVGGTNYTISGTSQLLSVPFALHAKKAENYTETDPLFGTSAASGITGTNITNWNTAFGWGDHSGLYRLVSWVPAWTDVTSKPTEFPPSSHSHSAANITSGTLGVERGGTGAATFTSGNVLIGSGTDAITTLSRSGIDTRTAFPPDAHNHSAADITSGILAVDRGGTGISSFTAGNYLHASGTSALEQRTPAQVLGDIGAAATSHTHGSITSDGKIGSTSGSIITTGTGGTLQATAGTATGQMLYWNGTAWVNVLPGNEGQILTFVGGVPAWKTQPLSGDVLNSATGKIWMDRNLGATQVATSSTDASSYGHLYQWGRGTDGHQVRTSGTTTTLSSTDTPGHGNFILATSSPYDWRSPQNTNLWQGVSGVNNPCPAGYRLPTEAEWDAERLSWSTNNAAGAFASPLKLPVAGYRSASDGSLDDVGTFGYYWGSTVSGTRSRRLGFSSSNATMNSLYRAFGTSVRCLKD